MKRATYELSDLALKEIISIHALCEEGDFLFCSSKPLFPISIHALCEEGDPAIADECSKTSKFQSTPSVKRATELITCYYQAKKISIHALCEEGDPDELERVYKQHIFQSTPSVKRATVK